jgi:hypothetical protein
MVRARPETGEVRTATPNGSDIPKTVVPIQEATGPIAASGAT